MPHDGKFNPADIGPGALIPIGHGPQPLVFGQPPFDPYARAMASWEANAAEKRAEAAHAVPRQVDATEQVIEERRVAAMQRRLLDTELAADDEHGGYSLGGSG